MGETDPSSNLQPTICVRDGGRPRCTTHAAAENMLENGGSRPSGRRLNHTPSGSSLQRSPISSPPKVRKSRSCGGFGAPVEGRNNREEVGASEEWNREGGGSTRLREERKQKLGFARSCGEFEGLGRSCPTVCPPSANPFLWLDRLDPVARVCCSPRGAGPFHRSGCLADLPPPRGPHIALPNGKRGELASKGPAPATSDKAREDMSTGLQASLSRALGARAGAQSRRPMRLGIAAHGNTASHVSVRSAERSPVRAASFSHPSEAVRDRRSFHRERSAAGRRPSMLSPKRSASRHGAKDSAFLMQFRVLLQCLFNKIAHIGH